MYEVFTQRGSETLCLPTCRETLPALYFHQGTYVPAEQGGHSNYSSLDAVPFLYVLDMAAYCIYTLTGFPEKIMNTNV